MNETINELNKLTHKKLLDLEAFHRENEVKRNPIIDEHLYEHFPDKASEKKLGMNKKDIDANQ